jgi:polyhydroxyalkanoate synthesis regulator phasin
MSEQSNETQNAARNVWLLGLGTVATIEAQTVRLTGHLREKGTEFKQKTESLAKKTIEDTVKSAEDMQFQILKKVDEIVADTVNSLGLPTHKQVVDLTEKIDEMTKKAELLKKKLAKLK